MHGLHLIRHGLYCHTEQQLEEAKTILEREQAKVSQP